MGNNLSRFYRKVPSPQAIAMGLQSTKRDSCTYAGPGDHTPMIMLPPINYTCSDPKKLGSALQRRFRQGWLVQCEEHFRNQIDDEWAALLAQIMCEVGEKHYGYARLLQGQAIHRSQGMTNGDCAVMTMWLLEEIIEHPWKVLRLFLLRARGPPVPPRELFSSLWKVENFVQLVDALQKRLLDAKRSPPAQLLVCWQCCSALTDKTKLYKCTGCGEARYCSRNCQNAHWPMHKEFCWRTEINKGL